MAADHHFFLQYLGNGSRHFNQNLHVHMYHSMRSTYFAEIDLIKKIQNVRRSYLKSSNRNCYGQFPRWQMVTILKTIFANENGILHGFGKGLC